jgi:hypothetical protein
MQKKIHINFYLFIYLFIFKQIMYEKNIQKI